MFRREGRAISPFFVFASKNLSISLHKIAMRPRIEPHIEAKCIALYSQGLSLRDVGIVLGISNAAVLKTLKRNEVPRRERGRAIALSKRNDIPIPEALQRMELLGDGHITIGRHQSCFSYGTSQKEYAEWLCDTFRKFGLPPVGVGVYETNTWDGDRRKRHIGYHFNTISTIQLHEQRQRWYGSGIKRVPTDLHMSHEVLLHWWIGDGSFNKHGKYGWLATDSFSEGEVVHLSQQVNDLLGTHIKAVPCRSRHKGVEKIVYRIYIPRESLEEIWHFTGISPVECYRYKWGLK